MNKKIPKKIFQIKFITAIDQVSISKKFNANKNEKQKTISLSHIARISVTNFHQNRFLYNKTKETSFRNGRNLSQTFFLSILMLFVFLGIFSLPLFSQLYIHIFFIVVQYLSKCEMRRRNILHLFKYHEDVFVMQAEFLCSIKIVTI